MHNNTPQGDGDARRVSHYHDSQKFSENSLASRCGAYTVKNKKQKQTLINKTKNLTKLFPSAS